MVTQKTGTKHSSLAAQPKNSEKNRVENESLPEEAVFTEDFAVNNPDHVNSISRHQLVYSLAGLILGLICVLGGVLLFLSGISGSSNITAKLLGADTALTDAAPGAILFLIGLLVVFTTRYVLKVSK